MSKLRRTAKRLAGALSVAEKASLLAGRDMWSTATIERLGVPAIRMTDGPNGARGTGSLVGGLHSACFPCGVSLGATWDPALVHRVGRAIADEARTKGARVLLAPTINLHRTALNGRNFECYSEDPFLTSAIAVGFVRGVQSRRVAATVKHFAGNESEFNRMTIDSVISERALRELYLAPFEATILEGGAKVVMTGYNRLNGHFCSENSWLLRDVLKGEWAFDGVVISDWFGTHSTEAALEAGLDIEMPGPPRFRGSLLESAIKGDKELAPKLDDSADRVVRLVEWVGATPESDPGEESFVDRPGHRALIREAAAAGMVLLKNADVLPLVPDKLESIAVIGPNAGVAQIMGGGSAQLNPFHRVAPLTALRERLGSRVRLVDAKGCTNFRLQPALAGDVRLEYFDNDNLAGAPVAIASAATLDFFWYASPIGNSYGEGFSARAVLKFTPDSSGPHHFGIVSAGRSRVLLDDKVLIDNWNTWAPGENYFGAACEEMSSQADLDCDVQYTVTVEYSAAAHNALGLMGFHAGVSSAHSNSEIAKAVAAARSCDIAFVFAGASGEWDGEGRDRPGLKLPGHQNRLISAVAKANPRTIVVLQTGGPVTMPWLDRVSGVLQAWYPGQECGHAICDVLFGDAEPGGRLPQSFPETLKDSSAYRNYPGKDGVVRYAEGIFSGYRHHDRSGRAPLFPFGFGLTYTTFKYGKAQVRLTDDPLRPQVAITVTNAGNRAGSEVVQLYVQDVSASVERPAKELKGFAKLRLEPKETREAIFDLDFRSFAFFDEVQRAWVAEAGTYVALLGPHAGDVRSRVKYDLRQTYVRTVSGETADKGKRRTTSSRA